MESLPGLGQSFNKLRRNSVAYTECEHARGVGVLADMFDATFGVVDLPICQNEELTRVAFLWRALQKMSEGVEYICALRIFYWKKNFVLEFRQGCWGGEGKPQDWPQGY